MAMETDKLVERLAELICEDTYLNEAGRHYACKQMGIDAASAPLSIKEEEEAHYYAAFSEYTMAILARVMIKLGAPI